MYNNGICKKKEIEKMNIIKIECIKQNISLKELSEKIGITERTMTNWVNGKIPNNIKSFIKLCKILGIKIEDL